VVKTHRAADDGGKHSALMWVIASEPFCLRSVVMPLFYLAQRSFLVGVSDLEGAMSSLCLMSSPKLLVRGSLVDVGASITVRTVFKTVCLQVKELAVVIRVD